MNSIFLKKFKPLIVLVSVFVLCYSTAWYIFAAWLDAPASPPNCPTGSPGCDMPLNAGTSYQTKTGILQIKNPDNSLLDNVNGNWFHISGYTKNFSQAKAACVAQGARLAYYSEVVDAYKNGADSCSWGWITEGFAVYPMQNGAGGGCGGAVGGVRIWYADQVSQQLGAYCARDSLLVNGSLINSANLYAKGIYLNSGQSAGSMYLGLLENSSNADKLGICLNNVCKTDWNQLSGPWTIIGNNISNSNTGNVGIGTGANAPTAKLDVRGTSYLTMDTTNPSNGHILQVHAATEAPWVAGFYNDAYSTTIPVFEYYGANTGMFSMGTPANKDIQIYTSGYGSPRLTITGAGNIGIGMSVPNKLLHLSSTGPTSIGITDSNAEVSGKNFEIYTNNGIGYITNRGDSWLGGDNLIKMYGTVGDISLQNDKVMVKNNGNVGIGTTGPGAKLHSLAANSQITNSPIYAGGFNNGGVIFGHAGLGTVFQWQNGNDTINAPNYGIYIGENGFYDGANWSVKNNVVTPVGILMQANYGNTGGIHFYVNTESNIPSTYTPNEVMTLRAYGLGIGTASPAYKIDVQGGQINASGGLCIAGDCKTAWSQITGGTAGNSLQCNADGACETNAISASGDVYTSGNIYQSNTKTLVAQNSAGSYEYWMWPRWSDNIMYTNFGSAGWNIRNNASVSTMFLTNSGNVGIGVTSPSAKLEIASPSSGLTMRIGRASGQPSIKSSDAYLLMESSGGVAGLNWYSPDNVVLGNGGGNVGVGTSNPTEKLHVVDARTTNGSAAIYAQKTGAVSGTAYGLASIVSGASTVNVAGYFDASGATNNYGLIVNRGNVGIGTTNPVNPLDVAGNVGVSGNIAVGGGVITNPTGYKWQGGGSWNTFYTPSGYVQIGPANTGWAHIYSDGKPFIFNTPVYSVANAFSSYNGDLILQRAGASVLTVGASLVSAPDFCTNSGKCLSAITLMETDPKWTTDKPSYATQSWVTQQGFLTSSGTAGNSLQCNADGYCETQNISAAGNIAATGDIYSAKDGYTQTYLRSWGLYSAGDIYLESGAGKALYLTDSWNQTGLLDVRFGSTVFRSGNVAIGNISPNYKLDVAGQINASGGLCIAGDCKTAWSQITGTNYWTLSGNNISSNNSGNIGIGTSVPNKLLHLSSTGPTSIGITDSNAEVSGKNFEIYTNNGIGYITNRGDSWLGGDNLIKMYGAVGDISLQNDKVMVKNNGNIGIGTTGPSNKLVVQTSTAFDGMVLNNNNGNNVFKVAISAASNGSGYIRLYDNSGNSNINLDNNGISYINGGNVGIGIVAPIYKLDVQGGQINASGGLCINGDCKTAWSQITSTNYWTVSGNNIANNNAGNVGIGTGAVAPTAKLEVRGGAIKATDGLILENRTSNPTSPVVGQIWVCVDPPNYDCTH